MDEDLIDRQNNDTICVIIQKLNSEKKVSLERYFMDDGLLHKIVREDDKIFHMLAVHWTLNKYILHQMHNALEHNGRARTYWYLKWVYMGKDYEKMLTTT